MRTNAYLSPPSPAAQLGCSAWLLGSARAVLTLEYSLALLWRLTGDGRFAHRAAQELLHVTTACATWDPFGLVLAEMTHAVGIGFDWLYHYLSPEQRRVLSANSDAHLAVDCLVDETDVRATVTREQPAKSRSSNRTCGGSSVSPPRTSMTTEKKVGERLPSKPSQRITPFSASKNRMPESIAACTFTHT